MLVWNISLTDMDNRIEIPGNALQWRYKGRLKSPASRLSTQPFIQAQMKEYIKAPYYCMRFYEMYFVRNDEIKMLNHYWSLCGELSRLVSERTMVPRLPYCTTMASPSPSSRSWTFLISLKKYFSRNSVMMCKRCRQHRYVVSKSVGHQWITLQIGQCCKALMVLCFRPGQVLELKSSYRWFQTPWRSCDVTVMVTLRHVVINNCGVDHTG